MVVIKKSFYASRNQTFYNWVWFVTISHSKNFNLKSGLCKNDIMRLWASILFSCTQDCVNYVVIYSMERLKVNIPYKGEKFPTNPSSMSTIMHIAYPPSGDETFPSG